MRSRSTREGSVGLLIILGLVTLFGGIFWLKGAKFGRQSYQIKVDFPQASGITVGSAVLFRGVQVGRVVSITPETNGIEAVLEISPANLRMTPDITIEPGRFGLIGEALVEITPNTLLTQDVGDMTPISSNCNSKIIVCDQDQFKGKDSPQLLATLSKIGELYADPEFYDNFIQATTGLSEASDRIIALSDDVSRLTGKIEKDLQQFTNNTTALTDSFVTTSDNISTLSKELTVISQNVNDLVTANGENISSTISSINRSSEELTQVLAEIRPVIAQVDTTLNDSDVTSLIHNLEVVTANLKEFSGQLNSNSNILVIQQTLDSARATFANAEKITADLDQLTGDPQFRSNVKRLVNGLSQLVASSEQLEQNIQTAQALHAITATVEEQVEILAPVLTKAPKPNSQ